MLWLLLLFGFLLGSIPFGLLIARSKGIDIRAHGSGNIGATNVFRVVGKKFGITCLLLDFLKGFIPVLIAANLIRLEGSAAPLISIAVLQDLVQPYSRDQQFLIQSIPVLTGLFAILGHNYSPWVGFRGGKGIATTGGALTAMMPMAVLLLIIIFAIVTFTTRYVSLGSIATALALPIITHLGTRYHHVGGDKSNPTLWEAGTWNKPLFFFALLASILAIWKHQSNLRRLLKGTENRFGSKKKPNP